MRPVIKTNTKLLLDLPIDIQSRILEYTTTKERFSIIRVAKALIPVVNQSFVPKNAIITITVNRFTRVSFPTTEQPFYELKKSVSSMLEKNETKSYVNYLSEKNIDEKLIQINRKYSKLRKTIGFILILVNFVTPIVLISLAFSLDTLSINVQQAFVISGLFWFACLIPCIHAISNKFCEGSTKDLTCGIYRFFSMRSIAADQKKLYEHYERLPDAPSEAQII